MSANSFTRIVNVTLEIFACIRTLLYVLKIIQDVSFKDILTTNVWQYMRVCYHGERKGNYTLNPNAALRCLLDIAFSGMTFYYQHVHLI